MKIGFIFPCFQVSQRVVENSIKKCRKFSSSYNIIPSFLISQNGGGRKYQISDKDCRIIYTKSRGLGLAFKNALQYINNEYFYISSPDLPFNFEDLKIMLDNWEEYDLIAGSKLHKNSIYKISLQRKLATHGQKFINKLLLPDFPVSDPNGSVFGLVKTVSPIALSCKENDFFMMTELFFKAQQMKLRIGEVPVKYFKNDASTTVSIRSDGFNHIKKILKLNFSQ